MKIHLWMCDNCPEKPIRTFAELDRAVELRKDTIHTILPAVLNMGYDKVGYTVVIHSYGHKEYEIRHKNKTENRTSYNANKAFEQYSKGARMV